MYIFLYIYQTSKMWKLTVGIWEHGCLVFTGILQEINELNQTNGFISGYPGILELMLQ